jgi:hypothetical protein
VNALVCSIHPDRIYSPAGQSAKQVFHNGLPASYERRGEASPEVPTGSFEYPLALHVFSPSFGAMAAIPIAFDCQSRVVVAFYDHVDTVVTDLHLRQYTISASAEFIENLLLER